MEQTLIIVKPEGVQRGLVGTVLSRFEQRGLHIAALKFLAISRELAEQHYGVHKEKPFFGELVAHITSGPVAVAVMEGPNAVAVARLMVGATDPSKSAPGTIRGDFALAIGLNIIHASDSPENGQKEVALFFAPKEIVSSEHTLDRWLWAKA